MAGKWIVWEGEGNREEGYVGMVTHEDIGRGKLERYGKGPQVLGVPSRVRSGPGVWTAGFSAPASVWSGEHLRAASRDRL